MFSFAKPFKVFVDGEELNDVVIIKVSRSSLKNDEVAENKVTIYYKKNGKERILTIDVGGVEFVNS